MPRHSAANSLSAVAALAKVSTMTVSRVLARSPNVTAKTRARVLAAVAKVGYRPDPEIARVMSVIRSAKKYRQRATIGVVRDDIADDDLHDPAYQFVSTSDIRARAEHHGYGVDEFLLGRDSLTARRLTSILLARGIEGLVVSPQSSRIIAAQLDLRLFAAVTFGYAMREPVLHRVSTNMMQGILMALEKLGEKGYRRIGIAISQWIDARADHAYSGAFLFYQNGIAKRNRVPMFIFPRNNIAQGRHAFCEWAETYKPDAVISFHTCVPEWLKTDMGLRIPQDIGLVVHDWAESMKCFAGIDHRRPLVAAAAVDLLVTQLMRHEKGVPSVPHQVLVLPAWVPGPSLRAGGESDTLQASA